MKDDTSPNQDPRQHQVPSQPEKNKAKKQDGDLKKLEQELEVVKQQLEQTQQQRIRAMADYQNQERRFEKEKQEFVKFANANLLLRVLDVADNLDRAAGYINDPGLSMVVKDMQAMLKEFGVEEIPVENKSFDPQFMECVDKSEGKPNMVLEVREKGYKLHDKILRPAKVIVGEKEE